MLEVYFVILGWLGEIECATRFGNGGEELVVMIESNLFGCIYSQKVLG